MFVCLTLQSHGTQLEHCVCIGGEGGKSVYDVSHRIEEKVFCAIFVKAPLIQENVFQSHDDFFGLKTNNIYTVGGELLHFRKFFFF